MSQYLKDLVERVAATFVGALIVALPASATDLVDWTVWEAALFAGGTAVLSLLKGLVARHTGPSDSAGLGT